MFSTGKLLISLLLLYASVSLIQHASSTDGKIDEDLSKSNTGTAPDSIGMQSTESLEKLTEMSEEQNFEAEVTKMMKLIINSLYKNKEIFLRELISNSADALDKYRFISLTDKNTSEVTSDLGIYIKINEKDKTLSIRDTGIGMTKEELTKNLGTIAKSGTAEFSAKLSESGNASSSSDLIGQFGVGFYSAYLVSDKVIVVSKSPHDDQYIWKSDASTFSVTKDPRGNTLLRGTEVILNMKDEALDYININTVKKTIKKYSQFVTFPIHIWESRTEEVEEMEDATPEKKTEGTDEDGAVEEEMKPQKKKTTEKTSWYWSLINDQQPIWARDPKDVEDEEYTTFFKASTHDTDAPLARIHFKVEGEVSFSCILYIPSKARSDLYSSNNNPIVDNIKLFVRHVFITDNVDELLPRYLAFIYGFVDSDDFPLNVSRETLQHNKLLKLLKKKMVRKVIEMISKLSKEDYEKFWREYSVSIKLGVLEDQPNKARLVDLLRFKTSHSEKEFSSFDEYISRMKDKQDFIYYIGAASLEEAKNSPFVERTVREGFEVIFMADPIDEFVMQSLTEVKTKKLQNLAKDGFTLSDSDDNKKNLEEETTKFQPLIKWLQNTALPDFIKEAKISQRLQNSPCALVVDQYAWSGNFERIMTAQAYQKPNDPSANYYLNQKKILEINPRHPLIKELNERVNIDSNDEFIKENAILLYETATLRSGYNLKDPVSFAMRVERLMRKNLDITLEEPVETDEEKNNNEDSVAPATDFDTDTFDEKNDRILKKAKDEL